LEQKQRFEKELERFMDLSHVQDFRISPAIRKIDEDKAIRKRSTELQTQHGGRIVLSSKSRKADAYRGDPTVRKARKAVGHDAVGRAGNFYWPSNNGDDREIHVKLYAQDQRIGIFGECVEEEIRHVLSSIRGYCN